MAAVAAATAALAMAAAALLAPLAHARAHAAAPVPPERALYTDAPNGMYLLESGWSSRADPHNAGLRRGWQRPGRDAGFHRVAIPNAFNARDLSRSSFHGGVEWYRARFTSPHVDGLTSWRVRFESVNVQATVWLNGKRLGSHRGAYLPFELTASRGQMRRGTNELVVHVDSRGATDDLPPASRPRGWWNFGGILGEVYLRAVRSFDLTHLYVSAAPGDPAEARVHATVTNTSGGPLPAPVVLRITGPDGFDTSAATSASTLGARASEQIDAAIPIPRAQLWTPSHPALYELTVDVPGGQRTTAHFGIRDWSIGPDGRIRLNGQPITLRGASFHEQTPRHGAALAPSDREQIVDELKSLHANFAREHYPPHPALLEAFDRAGIVFWEQIPVWRVRGTQLRSRRFRANALATLRGAILRDRSHASVLAWSISNETLRGGAGERAYVSAARRLVNRLDPTRLLAADKSLRPVADFPPVYRELDAIGLNDYVGWYGGRTADVPHDLASVHRRFPRQALVITEFGAEANRRGSASRKGTFAFQQRFMAEHLRLYDRMPYLSGALAWVLRDFAVRPGWRGGNPHPQPPWLFKGLFSRSGSPKPAARTVAASFARATLPAWDGAPPPAG